jgi:hypothetical protein
MADPEEKGPKIEVLLGHYDLRVLINGLLHIRVELPVFGIYSWMDSPTDYSISFHGDGSKMVVQYSSAVTWMRVLRKIAEAMPHD